MTDMIVIAILVVIVGLAVGYMIKAKKSGRKCIGCPEGSCNCSSGAGGCGCGCTCHADGE